MPEDKNAMVRAELRGVSTTTKSNYAVIFGSAPALFRIKGYKRCQGSPHVSSAIDVLRIFVPTY